MFRMTTNIETTYFKTTDGKHVRFSIVTEEDEDLDYPEISNYRPPAIPLFKISISDEISQEAVSVILSEEQTSALQTALSDYKRFKDRALRDW